MRTFSGLFAMALACSLTASANNSEEPIVEFALAAEGHRPQAIVPGPDGNLWVTEVIKHKILRVIRRIAPASGLSL